VLKDRLILVTYPDPITADRIGEVTGRLRGAHGLNGKPLPPELLHITLLRIGEYPGVPEDIVAAVSVAVDKVVLPEFDVVFDCVAGSSTSSFLLGHDGLAALKVFQKILRGAIETAGVQHKSRRSFQPHVTLLYGDHSFSQHAIWPIRWTVREFVLTHSLIGQTRHVPLRRWPLRS
jgi:RNA 2',3'-cyclic 3'-phosphodiesterase